MTSSLHRNKIWYSLVIGISLILNACRTDLYSNLNEETANKMLATLQNSQIDARKNHKGRKFSIQVDSSQFEQAQRVLENARATPSFLEKKSSVQMSSFPLSIQTANLHANHLKATELENLLVALEEVQSASVRYTSPVAPRFSTHLPTPNQVDIILTTQHQNAIPTWKSILSTALQDIAADKQNIIIQHAASLIVRPGIHSQLKNTSPIANIKLGPFWVAPDSFKLLQSIMVGLVLLCMILSAALLGILISRRSLKKAA